MGKFKKFLLVLLLLIGGLAAFIATRPEDFRIERTATIKAPPDVVFPLVNDFHNWPQWSPWEKLDPNMKKTFDGPAAGGTGASYAWAGNDQAGEGKMTIQDSKANELVGFKLEFFKPFAATNKATFTFAPAENATKVVWSMEGKNNFMLKAVCLFMNMDKMVGTDFEEGLVNLSKVAEAEVAKRDAAAKDKDKGAPPKP